MTGACSTPWRTPPARHYGSERVSELAHALRCAELAQFAGADPELTLASLLHDVGRFAVDQFLVFDRVGGARAGARGHQEVGADLKGARGPRSRTVQVSPRA